MNLRLKATAAHLLISALLVAPVVLVVVFVWFPGGYALAMGAGGLLMLVLGCHVVMGPLLSLVVCDPAKPRRTLVMDYLVIGSLQFAGLVYGVSVTMDSRPVFTVFSNDRFNIVAAFEVEQDATQPVRLSWTGPQLVALKLPDDAAGRNRAMDLEFSGKELPAMTAYHAPYDAQKVLAAARPMAAARPALQQALRVEATRLGRNEDGVLWLPVQTRFGFMVALLSRSDASILAITSIDAFE